MAGAISAGAYTAGVIDFLLEALDAIEDVRAGRPTGYLDAGLPGQTPIVDPPHDVQIRAMSGASAGSMATAIVATILGTRVPPVTSRRSAADPSPTNNPLYDAWVQQIHYDKLLSTGDLAKKEPVLSLLNSAPLNTIVDDALNYAKSADYRRPYFADSVPIYFCISNLRGVRYSLGLAVTADVPNEYQMSMHADWMEFLWAKNAASSTPGARTLSPGAASDAWTTLGQAALASGAFPIGLAAQSLTRDFTDYEVRQWYDAVANSFSNFPPLDRRSQFPKGYDFVNADGGIFNNEPLELCRTALAGGADVHNPREPEKATRAVVLIDPFPNLFDLEIPYDVDEHRQLAKVVTNLFSAMISQARFKVEELALAKAHDVASRYAIMPVRYDAQDKVAKYAIACGALGGFGGFLSKEFRHHDFMLGRRNCQRFLATHFSLPADRKAGVENPLFEQWPDDLRQAFQIQPLPSDPPGEPICLPIVPLLGKLASPQYTAMPPWPAKPADLRRKDLENAIIKRADALKASFIEQYRPGFIVRAGIDGYWWLKKKKWVDEFAIKKVADDLHNRGVELS